MPTSSASSGPKMVRGLQERAARALPAERVEHIGGWWLRYAPSSSWWAGTVLPHADAGPGELVRRVVDAEKFYARHGVTARFQISPQVCPGGLGTLLAERGYHRESPMSLRVASTASVLGQAPTSSLRIEVNNLPTDAWFEVWHAVHGHGGDTRSEREMLDRVDRPCAYACAMSGGDLVAVGRAVADTGWAGVFGMATLSGARGKGAARNVLAALADWAGGQAADRMYLQVERDNMPALRLYERTGFSEVSGYHYRAAA
jgi:N-acetylglutamate synthase